MKQGDGRRRVVVEGVTPQVDCGRFPIKRVAGDVVVVEADVFADGHDHIAAVLAWRHDGPGGDAGPWTEVPMQPLGNDRWRAGFPVASLGRYSYTVHGWIDRFDTWHAGLRKKIEAGQDVSVELLIGADLVDAAAGRAAGADATGADAEALWSLAASLREPGAAGFDADMAELVGRYPDRSMGARSPVLGVVVDRPLAAFGAWYELFPRSMAPNPGDHGTLADVAGLLPYVADMGFDIVYLPPIHPIGVSHRKGANNAAQAAPGEPGSPWAIGSAEGGHCDVHPDLGTIDDVDRLVVAAQRLGMEIALDFAVQCSPDHPWVTEHPDWFKARPDGTLQYAENPPKKYQDIYPIDFESTDWENLWDGLRQVVDFWVGHSIRVFRVDNPHTKAFAFWDWLIAGVKAEHPEVIFLAEAFTRPRVMQRLAKGGFSQSYTYFTWRSTKAELTQYVTELTTAPLSEYFRPNFWPNTPDILAMQLRDGGRPAFFARLLLAATLVGAYGIYGPAFELGEHLPVAPGSEEYRDSEKYQLRHWDLDAPGSLRGFIATVNTARRRHPALHTATAPVFHPVDNDQIIAYTRSTPDLADRILAVVNLDPTAAQWGYVVLPLEELGLPATDAYQAHDLLTGATFTWAGPRNFVLLDPALPAHLLVLGPAPAPGTAPAPGAPAG